MRRCEHCLRSLGILVLILLVLASLVLIPWYQKITQYDEQIAQMAARASKFESILARKPGLERQLQTIQEHLAKNNYFLQADTAALAAADLQQRVKRVVESNGGQLVSTQNVTRQADEKLVEVIIRVRMNGDVGALARALHQLESGKPLLLIDNLTVRSNKRYTGRGINRVLEFHQDTHFDLIGFLRGTGE